MHGGHNKSVREKAKPQIENLLSGSTFSWRHKISDCLVTFYIHAPDGKLIFTLRLYKRFTIPLPPLEEQARIVAILDRFDALTTDISSGLPAEITARQKQYEYYRDNLFTF